LECLVRINLGMLALEKGEVYSDPAQSAYPKNSPDINAIRKEFRILNVHKNEYRFIVEIAQHLLGDLVV
jgi:hypothetical protein